MAGAQALDMLLLGPQGAGKGVQAQYIIEKYGIPQISTGDLFRAMKTRTDALAQRIQGILAAGALVDDSTTNEVLAERLSAADAANGAILDGYPRTIDQADFLDGFLQARGRSLRLVLVLNVDFYTAFKRAFGRVTAADGTSYNVFYRAEDLDIKSEDHPEKLFPPRIIATHKPTGETLQRRADDANALAVIKRLDTYIATTQALIDHYQARGIVHTVDASQPIEVVRAAIEQIVASLRG